MQTFSVFLALGFRIGGCHLFAQSFRKFYQILSGKEFMDGLGTNTYFKLTRMLFAHLSILFFGKQTTHGYSFGLRIGDGILLKIKHLFKLF